MKRFLSIALLLALGAGFIGCGGEATDTAAPAPSGAPADAAKPADAAPGTPAETP